MRLEKEEASPLPLSPGHCLLVTLTQRFQTGVCGGLADGVELPLIAVAVDLTKDHGGHP